MKKIRLHVDSLEVQVRAAVAASHRAANSAIESQAAITTMRTEFADHLALQTREITRLLRGAIHVNDVSG